MNERFEQKPQPTPAQQKLIRAYFDTAKAVDNEANRQHRQIIRDYLLANGIDPENFREPDERESSGAEKIQAIREKYGLLRADLLKKRDEALKTHSGGGAEALNVLSQYDRQITQLEAQERQELAPFLRLDEQA